MRGIPPPVRAWGLLRDLAVQGVGRVEVIAARNARPDDRIGPWQHEHVTATVVACLAGVFRMSHAGGDLDLAPGAMVVVAPGAWHAHQPLRGGAATWAQGVLPQGSDAVLSDARGQHLWILPGSPSSGIIARLAAEPDPRRRCALATRLARLAVAGGPAVPDPSPAQRQMASFLWRNLHRGVGAAAVLAASGLGERQALRLFRAYFGCGPKAALTRQRLAIAARMRAEGMPVSDCAAASGFAGRAALARAWRNAYGTAPRFDLAAGTAGDVGK